MSLPTAFQFRRGATPGCGCRAEAWEEAARTRHQNYAAAEAAAKSVHSAIAQSPQAERFTAGGSSLAQPAAGQLVTGETVTGSIQKAELSTGEQTAALVERNRIEDFVPQSVREAPVVPETLVMKAADVAPVALVRAVALAKPTLAGSSAKSRKSRLARKKLPATVDGFAGPASEIAAAANPLKALQSVFSVGFVTPPIWGPGPNSALAPRGNTARDVFARNFY